MQSALHQLNHVVLWVFTKHSIRTMDILFHAHADDFWEKGNIESGVPITIDHAHCVHASCFITLEARTIPCGAPLPT